MACADNDTVGSLQATYKTVQQIAKALRVTEKDAQLRSFYAGRMAYCTIIYRHLARVSSITRQLNKDLIARLVDCTESIFTPSLLRHPASDRLRILRQVRDDLQALDDNDSKLAAVLPYLDFRPTPNQRDAFLESLTALDEELETRYPEDSSQWAPEDFAPLLRIKEPSYAVWSAAKSIIKALTGCKDCECSPQHDFGARLCLGTYRKPDVETGVDEDEVDFDMFLSMTEGWHEARVHTAKDRVVQLVVEQEDRPRPRQRQRAPKSMAVKQLCEPIARIGTMAAYRLELKVTKDRLFKLQSERSDSLVDKTKDPVSLDQFLRDRTGTFTERTRRILAVILSSAVFHLHNTPWLQPTWNSSGVLFFQTSSSAVTLRPFIQTRFSDLECRHSEDSEGLGETESDVDPDDWDPDDIDPDDLLPHPCPILLTLAVMLLEVYFVTPFDTLAKRYKVDLAPGQGCTRYLDVDVVFKACRREIPENSQFYVAVENCLNPELWETEQGELLSSQTLRTRIYEKVVLPLETELIQAYSSISIHDLDRFAQTLDFASWDQTIQVPNHQTNSEAAQQNSHIAVGCGLSPGPETPESLPGHLQYLGSSLDRAPSGLSHRSLPSRSSTQSPAFLSDAILSDSTASLSLETYSQWRYTVGILCALPKELLAVRALFDRKHNRPKNAPGDINNYALGSMAGHMVVAACLPDGEYGTNAAADSASNMKRTFLGIKFCLVVGIAGGAPTEEHDIRLGDVVVSLPTANFPGVMQYDRGKEVSNSQFEFSGALQPPPRQVRTAISSLRSNPDLPSNPLQPFLDDILDRVPDSWKVKYAHPGQENDRLFTSCQREARRPRTTDHPEIHYGLVGSGNRVIKDAAVRDQLARKQGILCFEMEAAGVMNTFPCLVIRGICDYADSYKSKEWQEYAAATAAAFAKLLLREVPCEDGVSWDQGNFAEGMMDSVLSHGVS